MDQLSLENREGLAMTAEQLESLPSIQACPSSIIITIQTIQLFNHPKNSFFCKLALRNKKFKTSPSNSLHTHVGKEFEFPTSFHSLLFDSLKFDIYECKSVLKPSVIGSVRVRLNNLPIVNENYQDYFPIKPKVQATDPKNFDKILGEVKLNLCFVGAEFVHDSPPSVSPLPLTDDGTGDYFTSRPISESGSTNSSEDSEYQEFYDAFEKELGINDVSSPPASSVRSPGLVRSNLSGSSSPSLISASISSSGKKCNTYLEEANNANVSPTLANPPSKLNSLPRPSSCRSNNRPLYINTANRSYSSSDFPSMGSPLSPSSPRFSFSTRYRSSSTSSVLSTSSIQSTTCNSGSTRKYSTKKGDLVSERTRLGLKELSELSSSFFRSGWKINKTELARAFLFLQKYFSNYHPHERTGIIVTNPDFLEISSYWLNFSMTTYGSLVMNYFGHGKGWLKDFLKINSDLKVACKHLSMEKEDIIVWEYGTGLEIFKPKFFICHDRRTNSIVVCFRGTFDIHDALTDLNADYEPFLGGFVHRGFLRSAMWVHEHFLEKIFDAVKKHQCAALYVVGHSLGGAIASLFTMIMKEYIPELKNLSSNFDKLYCIAHAPPPSASPELAEQFKEYVDSFVNENDVVPRMSYGGMMDIKELLISATNILKNKGSTEDKMRALNLRHEQLLASNDHPKICIVGNVYYIYKTSRVYGKNASGPPSWDSTSRKSRTSSISSNTSAVSNSTTSSVSYIGSHAGTNSKVEIDKTKKHYVVERSDRDLFSSIHIKSNFLFHHFPNNYEKGIRKSHDWLLNQIEEIQSVIVDDHPMDKVLI